MSRRAARPAAGIQLFPFLAVLICTMGSLVLLLIVFARHGQNVAAATRSQQGTQHDEIELERDELQWRIEKLQESRKLTETQLAEARLTLSHVEDHLRRLREQYQRLQAAQQEMAKLNQLDTDQSHAADAELATLQEQISLAERDLDAARQAARQRSVSYSIVPFNGANQTHRRPIYLECRANSVILQPEGIVLTEQDFDGPLGPGNPLASAMRAMREYLVAQQPPGMAGKQDPYPLMVVRPEGTMAYYAARVALKSWASDFGYELVADDWNVKYPPPDPQLAQLLEKVVAEARLRQRELLRALPERVDGGHVVLRASPRGGFERVIMPDEGGRLRRPGPDGFGQGGDGLGSRPFGGAGRSRSGSSDDGSFASGEPGDRGFGGGGDYRGTGAGNTSTGPGASRDRGNSQFGNSGAGDDTGDQPGGSGPNGVRDLSSTDSVFGALGEGDSFGGSRDAAEAYGSASDGATHSTRTRGNSGRIGQPGQGNSAARNSADGTQRGGSAGAQGGSVSGGSASGGGVSGGGVSGGSASGEQSQSGGPSASGMHHSGRSHSGSLADQRGRDWALRDAGQSSVQVTRPVLVECRADRLTILTDDTHRPEKEVRLGLRMEDSIDEFVISLWSHTKAWGMAGNGLHWKPVLMVDVQPGAADRYADLKSLLSNSGLEVKERPPQARRGGPSRVQR